LNVYDSPWRPVETPSRKSVFAPLPFRFRTMDNRAYTPISQELLSWLLFWPILSLIARQAVYFAGPAVSAEAFQSGAAMGGARDSHLALYVNLLFLLAFVSAGYKQVLATLKENPFIPTMLALAACSALWSTSAQITLQMSIEVGLCALFACYLSARYTAERLMQLLIFMGVVSGLLSIFFALALPAYGIFQGYAGGAWQGICDHKNTLGISMVFLLTPIFFTDAYSRWRKLIYSALLIFLIYKSQSRSAWFDTVGMLLFVGWLSMVRRLRARELPFILVTTVAVSVGAFLLGFHFWSMLTTSVGKDPTMTGREGIYIEVWRSILKHPLFGYGFGAFWYSGNFESQRIALALRWPNIGYAENGLMELALQIGLLGVGLLLAMVAKTIARGIFLLRSRNYSSPVAWYLTILFLAALINIDAGWFMTLNTLDWVLILVSYIGMNQEMRRALAA
jgi:exopolysaccharide production protein ExoQ